MALGLTQISFVFLKENFDLHREGIGFESPSKATQEGVIFYRSFMDVKASLLFWFGNGFPTDHIHFLPGIIHGRNNISLGFVNGFVNLKREMDKMHNIIRNASEGCFCKGCPTFYVEKLDFPPIYLKLRLSVMNWKSLLVDFWWKIRNPNTSQIFS